MCGGSDGVAEGVYPDDGFGGRAGEERIVEFFEAGVAGETGGGEGVEAGIGRGGGVYWIFTYTAEKVGGEGTVRIVAGGRAVEADEVEGRG